MTPSDMSEKFESLRDALQEAHLRAKGPLAVLFAKARREKDEVKDWPPSDPGDLGLTASDFKGAG